ncbi:MAG: 8-amino-7-oxononanoate synthase, partial [Actinomycetota bacterium]
MDDWTSALERIDADGLRRSLRSGGAGTEVERGGRTLVNLASNNYLGLASDPRVIAAAADAAQRFGVGSGASRLITGNLGPHEELESALAASRGTEAALVFSSGYAANLGVLSTVAGRHDLVFADALCHASLLDGIRLSGAKLIRYRHNDLDQLARLMATRSVAGAGRAFIVSEGVFSMDADVADLTGLAAIADRRGATLIVDDAHGGGILGPDGRGTIAAFGLQRVVPVQIGTLSKALGCQGGYVAGDRALIDLLINRARSFVFSTGLSPAVAAAARTALAISQEESWRRDTLREHGRH